MPTETDFVPPDIDCRDWAQIEPLVSQLLDRKLDSKEALARWLLERSDLGAYVAETGSRLHVDMTCHTNNEQMQSAYRAFNEQIKPPFKRASFDLDRKYYECPHRTSLPKTRYEVYDRDTATDIELFRPENVDIETELANLGQEHSRITGAQTVDFDGKERTLPEMSRYQEDPERKVRESAWRAVAARRGQDRDALREVFDKMLVRRTRIAANAGFENYRDYAFRSMHRFDYTPSDCHEFHDAIEAHIVPLNRKLGRLRAAAMGLDSYRPWDIAVDVHGRGPLDPFGGDEEQMVEAGQQIFDALDEELGRLYRSLRDGKSLDLATRVGKAPGGYQTTFAVQRKPFIFMNAAALGRDLRTLLHEAGHAFHTLLGGNDPLLAYRHAPIEFCEVASMSMELTALDYLDRAYQSDEDANRARRLQLTGIVTLLPWIAQIDAFQHWMYTNPTHSHDDRAEKWIELDDRFGGDLDWSGLEGIREEYWQRQLHLFMYPFYYVEYGIAQLGALQVWLNYKQDSVAAIAAYKTALSLGGARPLPQLFEACDIGFDFGSANVERLIRVVESELEELPL